MTNVKQTYFLTKDEAGEIHETIDYTMPQYELENGQMMYAHITGADIMTYHAYDTLEDIVAYKKSLEEAWSNR